MKDLTGCWGDFLLVGTFNFGQYRAVQAGLSVFTPPARSLCLGTKEEGDREISSSRDSPPVRTKKPRKARTAFTDHQLNQLERSFERQKYLSVQDRMDLAAALNLTDTQVKTWYQNRRWVSENAPRFLIISETNIWRVAAN